MVVTAYSYTGIPSKNVTYKSEVRNYVLAYQFLLYAVFEYTVSLHPYPTLRKNRCRCRVARSLSNTHVAR